MCKKLKIAIWMNYPSHYQRAFFHALASREDVNLEVRYFHNIPAERLQQGWQHFQFEAYEQSVAGCQDTQNQLETIPDWRERIHVTGLTFNRELVHIFCREQIRWCHWSECLGGPLAKKLDYNLWLFHLLLPLLLFFRRPLYRPVAKYAMIAFGQGELARRSFLKLGIPEEKIRPLFYSPAPLPQVDADTRITAFARGRKVFLSVGMLNKRKGMDLLLKAFAGLKTSDWCLVLCGKDLTDGKLEALAKHLGIQDSVMFYGAISSESIASVYQAADVDILASRFDGWGAVLNEGASRGLALIGVDSAGASWHLVSEGENGFRIPGGNVRALTKAMAEYVNNPELCTHHGINSRRIFFEKFSPECNAERLISSIREKICGL
ncbi:Glycosyltransferase Gtf1 [bioreactor metagenome]|uniref:Glycosyltransferase Gtf1 n=1 Tax=bioreactor metagenome TaxID=1076179 RepID=A0A644Y928_9ZZZZ